MTARERILRRLRSARATARLPRMDVPSALTPAVASVDQCVARFTIEASALDIACYVESSPDGVRERLAAVIGDLTVLCWEPEYLPYDAARVLHNSIRGSAPLTEQASAAVGVTGCDAAVAETGSLVVFSAPGRSRAVSLLPPLHVALVERRQVCFSMSEVFERHRDRFAAAASCTFITGPSRTADIELTLTLGIHGPGRVAVIIGP
jgi:L-lactate dehydrogenase complex protein LldG